MGTEGGGVTPQGNNPPATSTGDQENRGGEDASKQKSRNRSEAKFTSANYKPVDYKGKNKDIGVILALRDERFTHRVVYTAFVEKLKNYVLQNYDYPKDMVPILSKLQDPKATIEANQPTDSSTSGKVADAILNERIKKHIARLTILDNNKVMLYGAIWGQCSVALQEVIKTDDDFIDRDTDFDCIWLLKRCKMVSSGIDERGNKHHNLVKSLIHFVNIRQHPMESNDSFRTRLDAAVLTLELANGKHILCSDKLIESADTTKSPTTAEITVEEEKFKAMLMVVRADGNRYGSLQANLEEGVLLGRDEYPKTITAAYELLQKTCAEVPKQTNHNWRFRRNKNNFNNITNLSFAQTTDAVVAGLDGKKHPHIVCHACNKRGHYANCCPEVPTKTKVKPQFAQFVLKQSEESYINPNWLLLDTCSTVSAIKNPTLLTNIRPCRAGEELHIVTNGGSKSFAHVGTLKVLPLTVHYNHKSLANILSLKDVANIPNARLTMDTMIDRAIILTVDGTSIRF